MAPSDLSAPFRGRPRIGLLGFYGWGNYGDELFLQQWRRVLGPGIDAGQVHDLLKAPFLSRDADEVAREYDAFVIGGGDLVLPYSVSSLYWNRAWLAKRVYIVGVGVPLWRRQVVPEAVAEMAEFFRHPSVQHISARDAQSAAWIREHLRPSVDVQVHPDLIFAAGLPPGRHFPEDKVLGITVRQETGIHGEDFSALAQLAEAARQDGYTLKAIVLGSGRQYTRERQALQTLPFRPDEVIAPATAREMSAAIGGLDAYAGVKYHGLLVAARYGVPSLALAPNVKNTALFADLGRTDLVVDASGPEDGMAGVWPAMLRPVDADRVRALETRARVALHGTVAGIRAGVGLAPSRSGRRGARSVLASGLTRLGWGIGTTRGPDMDEGRRTSPGADGSRGDGEDTAHA